MSKDVCVVYRKLCLRNQIPVDETIFSCLHNLSMFGELNLSNITITDTSSMLIAKTLKLVPIITILNLSNCLLSYNGLKNFLDVINQLKQLSQLNLKRNQIENNQTLYISKILFNNNSSITELQLDWNNIGASVDTFNQLCNSLISNTILKTLHLSNNNLCQECGFYLADMLNINKCLRNIDLSWNCIGEEGAALLLKSLRNNKILIKLNIKGNSVSIETSIKITEQLKHNQLNEINTSYIQKQNLNSFGHVVSVDTNYPAEFNCLENQYLNHINELQSKLCLLEKENQQQKQNLELLKNNYSKTKESNTVILDQVEQIKSELSLKNQSLSLLIKKISNKMSNTEVENINSLEDFEKIIYIIKKIENKYDVKMLKDSEMDKNLLENISKFTSELNSIRAELKDIRYSTEIDLINYFDELSSIKKLFFINMSRFKILNKDNNEMHMNNLREQQEKMHISDEQANTLILLNEELKTLHPKNTDLKLKLTKLETQSIVDTQTMQALENTLVLTKEKLNELNENQIDNLNAQHLKEKLCNDSLTKEINIVKMNLVTKDQQFQIFDLEKNKMIINYTNKLLTLEEHLMSEKQKFKEKRKEDQNQIEQLYLMFSQYVNKFKKDNLDCENN